MGGGNSRAARSTLGTALGMALWACAAHRAQAQDQSGTPAVNARSTKVRFGFEQVTLPATELVGLAGASYLVDLGAGISLGPAVYGTFTGRRGGLFVVGGELAWRRAIARALSVGAGVYAGGGGGGAAPVGDGLMLRPHLDLMWDFGTMSSGLSWSRVRFVNGDIDSRQLGATFSVRTAFRHVGRDRLGEFVSATSPGGLGFDRVLAVAGAYLPAAGTASTTGTALPGTIRLVGVRAEQDLAGGTLWGIEAAGAASGEVAGYAEVLAALGFGVKVGGGPLSLGGRVAAGLGGGGGIAVGGGPLLRGSLTTAARLTRDLSLVLDEGYTAAPDGNFRAAHVTAALNWTVDSRVREGEPVPVVRMEWFGGVEGYDAVRKDGSVRDLQAVVLRVNRFVSPSWYLTGQVRSALGGGAGAYTVGLLGPGAHLPIAGAFHGGAELLVGAAGGGGVDTGSGIVAQPMVWLGCDIGTSLVARVGVGRIRALKGPLDGRVVEATLGFAFGVPGLEHR